ncbi:solute carrier family 66 member 3 isoform X3 [Meles meles]|uniref:solute carrier family 66 member 3 isoform X3 n=1 Tax=Meles meles TaxID=9662 RepID=UPI001E698F48|nr:solute carrier family 66 member 3 isoform X3 [Meles meles]XP_045835678.1 solute carrier family 66 member 3 isoform X3 [Meles meles]
MRAQLLLFCNWSTLGVCGALKLPQISAVLAARSARGISLPSLLLELAGFLVFLRYQCYYEYPLLTYLEYPILIAQDVLLLLCVFHFNGNVRGAVPYLGAFVASWFVLPLQKWTIDLAMDSAFLLFDLRTESEYLHQRGQQVCAAAVPVEDQGLGSRERPHLEPRLLHLRHKNNNNFNDHQ